MLGWVAAGMFSAMWVGYATRASPVTEPDQAEVAKKEGVVAKFPTLLPTELPTTVPSALTERSHVDIRARKGTDAVSSTLAPTDMPTTSPSALADKSKKEEEETKKPTLLPTESPTTIPSWYIAQEKSKGLVPEQAEVPSALPRARIGKNDMFDMKSLAADAPPPTEPASSTPSRHPSFSMSKALDLSLYGTEHPRWALGWALLGFGFLVVMSMAVISSVNKGDKAAVSVSLHSTLMQAPELTADEDVQLMRPGEQCHSTPMSGPDLTANEDVQLMRPGEQSRVWCSL